MSGIYIPGMEMPTCCDDCWALDEYGDYPRCRITNEQRGYNFPVREQRMAKCPLVPVPEHGRLIDADALIMDSGIDTYAAVFAVASAPTIIPASGGKENE